MVLVLLKRSHKQLQENVNSYEFHMVKVIEKKELIIESMINSKDSGLEFRIFKKLNI